MKTLGDLRASLPTDVERSLVKIWRAVKRPPPIKPEVWTEAVYGLPDTTPLSDIVVSFSTVMGIEEDNTFKDWFVVDLVSRSNFKSSFHLQELMIQARLMSGGPVVRYLNRRHPDADQWKKTRVMSVPLLFYDEIDAIQFKMFLTGAK